ncbi:MAG: DNA integrity scanning protein DisA nucleotide-binding domain protein [Planctomycetaceae bacterium]|jgi:DNA integrity scanning protein DisA with diadenylate cyclase activity|nr:DNA integrity scanning protein DisA nucleotide-binding domain protein [Planctomycetaceae bacterium]
MELPVFTATTFTSCGVFPLPGMFIDAPPENERLPLSAPAPYSLIRKRKYVNVTEPLKFTEKFKAIFDHALQLYKSMEASAILLLTEMPIDWLRLKKLTNEGANIIATSFNRDFLQGTEEAGLPSVFISTDEELPVYDILTQAILRAVADDLLMPGSRVVAVYSGFDPGHFDSVSLINLGEHLDRLSGRDLRQLETKVPLKTLKIVVDLAVEIGREGREGKSVGSLFVIGDTRKVLMQSKPAGFDPVRGYHRKERNLNDPRVREGIKEIAQLDGAFIIAPDGTCEAACRYLDTSTATITLSKGLGARHWAGAAVSRMTDALAIVVSQSSGTVRIFQNGEVILRIESRHRRPMVWREFDYDPPAPSAD